MFFDFAETPANGRDKLLHSTIVPRPIGWVLSLDGTGRMNMAPFSFFNVFAADPPTIALGIGARQEGESKHTSQNIRETAEFTVHLVSYKHRRAMNLTATPVDRDIDEVALSGLTIVPSRLIRPPRIAESPVAMECRLQTVVELAPNENLIVARVLAMHIDDDAMEDPERYYVDTAKLDLIARMHGSGWYVRLTDVFQMRRLTVADLEAGKESD